MISSIGGMGGCYDATSMFSSKCSDKDSVNKPETADDLFTKADINGDDELDKSELATLLESLSPKNKQTPNIDNIFAKLDTNGDGKISKEELSAGLQATHHRRHHHKHPAIQQYEANTQDPSASTSASTVSVSA